jgi:colanic acid/amylovoran biosynthesis glycosyltransferase
VYTQLQAQSELEQAVFARRRSNQSLFPFAPVSIDPIGRYTSALVRHLPSGFPSFDPYPRRLADRLRRFQPDVIHAHFGWAAVDTPYSASELSTPTVTAFHGADVYAPESAVPGMPGSYEKLFAAGTLFTCVGPSAAAALARRGCPADRIRLVPVGIDLAQFRFAPAPRRGSLVFLQVGRLVPKKGTDLAIRAFARAQPAFGSSELWIVGDGPERERLVRLTTELGIGDRVTFWGAQPASEVRRLMGRAHLGVQPSRVGPDGDREGTPTVILEMQATGVDVVATRHSDIPFIVPRPGDLVGEDDVAGLAMELARRAEASTSIRDERLTEARTFVERRHDANRIARQLCEIYAEAVSCRQRRGREADGIEARYGKAAVTKDESGADRGVPE